MGFTQITIVRHGETEWNKALQLQGHSDSALTEEGLSQAEMLSVTMRNKTFDVCYTSDLGRAKLTTEIITRDLDLEIKENSQLRERSFGVMESRQREDLKNNEPELFNAFLNRVPDYPVPGGESLSEFYKRVISALDLIIKDNPGKKVLVVAHGGVLDCVIRRIFNLSLDQKRCFNIYNTSVNTFSVNNGDWVLEEWGNIDHLNQSKVLDEVSR